VGGASLHLATLGMSLSNREAASASSKPWQRIAKPSNMARTKWVPAFRGKQTNTGTEIRCENNFTGKENLGGSPRQTIHFLEW